MLSLRSRRWRGNEVGMRVISFQDVRNSAEGQRVIDGSVPECARAYLLRQVGEDLCADPIQSLDYLSLLKESIVVYSIPYFYHSQQNPVKKYVTQMVIFHLPHPVSIKA